MDYADDDWGLYRDYYRDPFSHSLLSTRQYTNQAVEDEQQCQAPVNSKI